MEGRDGTELRRLLDAIHRVVVDAFGVPDGDRYQILHEHRAGHFIVEDTGLGIARTANVVLIEMTSRPRRRDEKEGFYRLLCATLHEVCRIDAADVVVAITENSDEDWSFGHGRAQFLTGELASNGPHPVLRRDRDLG
jgi:phenylpyruvate tautomerase PptA (4-oxalocrotonate tautomerase family)